MCAWWWLTEWRRAAWWLQTGWMGTASRAFDRGNTRQFEWGNFCAKICYGRNLNLNPMLISKN
jgi:hypothetical protein